MLKKGSLIGGLVVMSLIVAVFSYYWGKEEVRLHRSDQHNFLEPEKILRSTSTVRDRASSPELRAELFRLIQVFQSGDIKTFKTRLEAALLEHGEDEHLLSLAADFFYKHELYEEAFQYTERLLALEPGKESTRLRLAELHGVLGRFDEAITQSQQIFEDHPTSRQAAGQYYALSFKAGRSGEAVEYFYQKLEENPGNPAVVESLWKTPELSNSEKQDILQTALESNPQNSQLKHLRSLEFFLQGQHSESRRLAEEILKQDISNTQRALSEDMILQNLIVERNYDRALERIARLEVDHPEYVFLKERKADIELRRSKDL